MLTKFGFKKKHHYHLISQYNLFHFQFSRAQPFLEVMPNTCVQGCPSRNLTSNLSLASRHLQMRRKKQLQGDQHLACDQLLGRDLVTYGYMGVPKSWGYPQSSSISNDGIFHELNHQASLGFSVMVFRHGLGYPLETFCQDGSQGNPHSWYLAFIVDGLRWLVG